MLTAIALALTAVVYVLFGIWGLVAVIAAGLLNECYKRWKYGYWEK